MKSKRQSPDHLNSHGYLNPYTSPRGSGSDTSIFALIVLVGCILLVLGIIAYINDRPYLRASINTIPKIDEEETKPQPTGRSIGKAISPKAENRKTETASPNNPETQAAPKRNYRPEVLGERERSFLASELINAYESNEIAADKEFKGYLVTVHGRVSSVRSTPRGAIVILGGFSSSVLCIACRFNLDRLYEVEGLRTGSQVMIAGLCLGKSWDIIMEDCMVSMLVNY